MFKCCEYTSNKVFCSCDLKLKKVRNRADVQVCIILPQKKLKSIWKRRSMAGLKGYWEIFLSHDSLCLETLRRDALIVTLKWIAGKNCASLCGHVLNSFMAIFKTIAASVAMILLQKSCSIHQMLLFSQNWFRRPHSYRRYCPKNLIFFERQKFFLS